MSDARAVHAVQRLFRDLDREEYQRVLRHVRRLKTVRLPLETRTGVIYAETEARIRLGDYQGGAAGILELHKQPLSQARDQYIAVAEALLWAWTGDARRAIPAAIRALRTEVKRAERTDLLVRRAIGVALYRLGRYRWAANVFEMCAAHHRIRNERAGLADALINLALVAKNSGRPNAALSRLDDAIAILSTSGHYRSRTIAILNRGVCLQRLGRIEQAIDCFLQAKAFATKQPFRSFQISISNNLGHVYRMRGNFGLALQFYSDALAQSRAEDSRRRECLALEFLGETYLEQGVLKDAMTALNDAISLAESLSGGADLAMEVLRRRGESLLALGRPEEARADLERARRMCTARGERREGLLTDRSYFLAFAPADERPARVREVLDGLREIDDRFEFVRTVCFAIEHGLRLEEHDWLHDAYVSACHYISLSGLEFWKKRLERAAGFQRALTPKRADSPDGQPAPVFSHSAACRRMLDAVQTAARSGDPALVLGETGSGKEVVARLLHSSSARAARPLIGVNCAAIPEHLLESELFGHVRGAFTGADRDRTGLFEAADGGSVLLDEIGDLPMVMQVKLLRFLDNYELRRIGDSAVRRVDVRIIAATNKDLAALVAQNAFRSDLYFRLKVFRIDVPPVRERVDDIPDLVRHFMRESAYSGLPLEVSAELMQWFQAFPWPGNVRELRSVCRYLAARVWGRPQASLADLPPEYGGTAQAFDAVPTVASRFETERDDLKRQQIERALHETGGNILQAARLLNMGRNNVARRMRQYGLRREDFRDAPRPSA